jgi:AAA domain
MKRRVLIAGLLLAAAPGRVQAQQTAKVYRIALVDPTRPIAEMRGGTQDWPEYRAFFEELRRLGYIENQNLLVDRFGAEQRANKDFDELALTIAPYNGQVFELQARLPGAQIGTIDKFQGQEAPLVIYSMITSSYADAPRGMEFLCSSNRLNVATSRAKCVRIRVASSMVFEADRRTPTQMRLSNAYCRYLELAHPRQRRVTSPTRSERISPRSELLAIPP